MSRANEPAFPVIDGIEERGESTVGIVARAGLTVREYFTGLALQNCDVTNFEDGCERVCADVARRAVALADAAIAELAKPVTP